MEDPTPPSKPSHGNGARPVTNADLQSAVEILGLNIKLTLTEIGAKIETVARQQISDGAAFVLLTKKVEDNAEEIRNVRAHSHNQTQSIQALELRTAPITLPVATEIVSGMPEIRRGMQLLKENEFKNVLTQEETDVLKSLIKKNADMNLEYVKTLKEKQADQEIEYARKLREKAALEKIEFIETMMKSREKHDSTWHGISRELVVVMITLVGLVVLGPIFVELVNHFVFGKPF